MFDSISPLEYRYLQSSSSVGLREYFSEEAFVRYLARVEAALVEAYSEIGLCSVEVAARVKRASAGVSAAKT